MPSRWVTARADEDLFNLPRVSACYVIYASGRLVYIGSTENLRSRVGGYLKVPRYSNEFVTPWGRHMRVVVKYRPSRRYGDWAMVELRLIRRLQPTGNTRGVRRKTVVG